MIIVQMHSINPVRKNIEKRVLQYLDWLSKDIPILQDDPEKLSVSSIFNQVYRGISYCEWLKKDKSLTYQFLYYANQLGVANYTLACEDLGAEQEVEVQFGSKHVRIRQKFTRNYVGTYTWIDCINVAIILRDQKAIAFLNTVSLALMEWDQAKSDPFNEQYTNFIKSLFTKKSIEDEYNQAIEMYQDGHVMESRKPYVEHIHYPELLVYEALLKEDNALFTQRLVNALKLHKQYYSHADREGDPWGWVCYGLTAACCIAYDRGMQIHVVSEYLPEWMIRKEFEGIPLMVE